ncbi:MAG: hypothetical protein ACXAC7_08110 [Candidatus Hodarchaeales archaeon]|jgi:hypothetical protein
MVFAFQSKNIQSWLKTNHTRIEIIFLIISLFGLFAPFTSINKNFSSWIFSLESNWLTFTQVTQKNPIWLMIQALLYQVIIILEYNWPTFFGIENNFLIRFFLKLPLLILYILSAFLFEFLIYQETHDQKLAEWGFYLSLGNLPLFYTMAIWGSPEVLVWTFLLISLILLSDQRKWVLMISGAFLAVVISFNFLFLSLIVILLFHYTFNEYKWFLLGLIINLVLILVPWIVLSQETGIVANDQPFGLFLLWELQEANDSIMNILTLLGQLLFIVLLFFGIAIILKYNKESKIIDKISLMSTLLILFSPILSLADFLVLQQILILTIFYQLNQKIPLNIPELNISINIPKQLLLLIPFLVIEVIFLFIAYPTTEIYHIEIMHVFTLGEINQSLDKSVRDLYLLFLGICLVIIITITQIKVLLKSFLNNYSDKSNQNKLK